MMNFPRAGLRHIALVSTLFAIANCAPIVPGADQCQNVNYEVFGQMDQQFLGSWPAVDTLMNSYVESTEVTGCAVAVIHGREIAYIGTYGLAATPGGDMSVPVSPATVFPVGSISKPITAMALLRLVEDGHIDSIDDPIGGYLPFLQQANPALRPISLRRYLSHTSGLDADPDPQFAGAPFTDANSLELAFGPFASLQPELTGEMQAYATDFDPAAFTNLPASGSFFVGNGKYSNSGYGLLGAVIDVVARDRELAAGYEDYVYRNVALDQNSISADNLMPTMCLNTYWRNSGDIPMLAKQFGPDGLPQPDSGPWGAEGSLWGWEGPSGGWSMIIGDLARFALVAARSERLSPSTTAVWTENHVGRVRGYSYALGLDTETLVGRPAVGHAGTIGAYHAQFSIQEDDGFGLAMACNSGRRLRNPDDDPEAIFGQVAAAAANTPSQPALETDGSGAMLTRIGARHAPLLARMTDAMRDGEGRIDEQRLAAFVRQLTAGDEALQAAYAGDYLRAAELLDRELAARRAADTRTAPIPLSRFGEDY